uniref:Uncharacterized protein n=1 Tax=Kalanchoe fedtschenkoi TaxID=63787 RepID=A0A7N0UN58_KALFE
MAVTSKVKRSLGLKMLKRSPSKRTSSMSHQNGSMPSSPGSPGGSTLSPGAAFLMHVSRQRRPLTSAELMRQQMKVTEYSDNRLRKTLLRTLVGQMGRRAETIILPLELLRHLKPSEFSSSHEYHMWQRRQLKILETGLLIHPSIPLDKSNSFAIRLQEIIQSSETKPIDTSKNSEMMRTLCNSVVSLAWRSADGSPTEVCHWADGYPFNIHLYISLLHSIFDLRDETMVVDEVDELLELIKKTWSTLGIGRAMHNLCFAWTLFQQYILTSQLEPDLLGAALVMMNEVAADAAKRTDKEAAYLKMLPQALGFIKSWCEKKLMSYHDYYQRGNAAVLEHLVPLALTATKILNCGDVSVFELTGQEKGSWEEPAVDPTRHRVDHYIRSSIRNAFVKILQSDQIIKLKADGEESELLVQLANEVEDLTLKEKECFSNVLRKWHPVSGGVAAVTLHTCYGAELRRYLSGVTSLTKATVAVLERAGKLEKVLLQIMAEESESCGEGGKGVIRELSPFEVDSVVLRLLRKWIVAKLTEVKDCVDRAKETESWNPSSKIEPFAHSGMELVRIAQEAVDAFFENPIPISENLVHDLADGLQILFQDYTAFVSSCGSKQNYIPALPPLTRCGRDSKLRKLLKKARPCHVGIEGEYPSTGLNEGIHPRQSMSRGTQRLYVRLNTLHYLQTSLNSLDKTLTLAPRVVPSNRFNSSKHRHNGISTSYFGAAQASIQTAIQHVAEVAGYRLTFLDSNSVFCDSLYVGGVANARIWPALRLLKQNLTLLCVIVTDKAQPLAVKEVMKASFEGYLTVLLAGGPSRLYCKSDNQMIAEDFDNLKRVFAACGEGLLSENVVEHEASVVEGVLELMGQSTEQLMEEFCIATCETSGIALLSSDNKLPMPPTTGRWNRSDPNTILRVLCYRKDRLANHFLKKTFQLARKR